ncbi:L-serine ammonia-lyase [Bifidobacterium sp.]|jgi:L-serine dehydratase|uniref:L-serine ammonia-lyase n=1 Tax=Bifidobacterium sp. TaxID=41200 RepID=UPI0025BFBF20|nr:L-serine ammonia-lyase [Bifidobacterium sp.]MCH4209155.1 L-serine ammonia-lyase [Bifidobacterium sp.]MCI1224601.1 L-serine ammonia-lyase [Bifidobacterium sp.]
MFSVLDMFTIGVGPSSSHTVGPMRAANAFVSSLRDSGVLTQVARVRTVLYGSLAMTGMGHGTDRAAVAGLEGSLPSTVDTEHLLTIKRECKQRGTLALAGEHSIAFDYDRDVVFELWQRLAAHPNGMRFQAFDDAGDIVDEQVWYSIGGGFIRPGGRNDLMIGIHEQSPKGSTFAERDDDTQRVDFGPRAPYHFASCSELIAMCERTGLSICEIVWANESAMRPADEVRGQLLRVWELMRNCIMAGCTSGQATLPGGLEVRRRAPKMYRTLSSNSDVLCRDQHRADAVLESSDAAWVNLFALAVCEENAGGGRIVTAPTNGAAGIIPAVLQYYWTFVDGAGEDGIVRFLLTAGAIGYLFKRNGSISGAEVGCQGEVGSACSMAAAGLCEVMGGTPRQVENAAEIGIEHHLGLTCDPVGGLVQIPCIERNAMAANTAINAVRMAMFGDGSHLVSLDQAIKTMMDTGADMMSKYKETSQGGLAVNVVEC